MSTQARGDTEQIKKTRINNIEQVQGRGLEHFIDQLSLFLKETNHEVMKTVSEMCHETGEITYVNQQKSSMSREDSRALLKSTKIPVLFIVGRNDQGSLLINLSFFFSYCGSILIYLFFVFFSFQFE